MPIGRVTRWRSTILFTHVQETPYSLRVSETKSRHLETLPIDNICVKYHQETLCIIQNIKIQ